MIFPVTININKRLRATITPGNQRQILQYIVKSVLDEKADNVVAEDMHITCRGSTIKATGALFKGIDYGIFSLIYKDGSWWLNYRFNMRGLFVSTLIISSIAGVLFVVNGGPWWIGGIAFLWLGGVNWAITSIRHRSLAIGIVLGIDEMIFGKPEELPEQDKMTGELKSWY